MGHPKRSLREAVMMTGISLRTNRLHQQRNQRSRLQSEHAMTEYTQQTGNTAGVTGEGDHLAAVGGEDVLQQSLGPDIVLNVGLSMVVLPWPLGASLLPVDKKACRRADQDRKM